MKFFWDKSRVVKTLALFFTLTVILATFGCEQPAPVGTTNVNANISLANANTNANVSTAPVENNKNLTAQMPVTLPVLDAMFADQGFSDDLKSKVQLTDEQIDKLKNISRQAVQKLRENDNDADGSTRASTERAVNQIRQVVGVGTADKFFNFVRERWSGGVDEVGGSSDLEANAIPTDTRIVVNAPEYRMDVFQEGKLIKSYKVGIGYPEFPLPSGLRKANEIIFNPTWTPPDEPWVEASNKVQAGVKVSAGDKLNPLGPIKIPIGLPSLIHGGKNPAKLGTFASHGCVGLTNKQVQDFSLDLANISGTQLTKDDVSNYEKQKTETKNVKLGKPIPVEIRYQTIVVEDGKLKILRDVYEKGTNTEENLRKVLDSYGVSFDTLKEPDQKKILDGLEQMALDAGGKAVETGGNMNANVNSNSNMSNTNAKNKSADADKKVQPKITRAIKGKKEIVFNLAELKGKGYPAPVNLNTGS